MSHRMRRILLPGLAATLAAAASAHAATSGATHTAAPAKAPAAHLISHSREAVPFMPDDYSGALSAAHAARVPIFVEMWAPW